MVEELAGQSHQDGLAAKEIWEQSRFRKTGIGCFEPALSKQHSVALSQMFERSFRIHIGKGDNHGREGEKEKRQGQHELCYDLLKDQPSSSLGVKLKKEVSLFGQSAIC